MLPTKYKNTADRSCQQDFWGGHTPPPTSPVGLGMMQASMGGPIQLSGKAQNLKSVQ